MTPLTAVQIRSGSSTGCAALGSAQASDKLDYYCYKVGWVRDDNMRGDGSLVPC